MAQYGLMVYLFFNIYIRIMWSQIRAAPFPPYSLPQTPQKMLLLIIPTTLQIICRCGKNLDCGVIIPFRMIGQPVNCGTKNKHPPLPQDALSAYTRQISDLSFARQFAAPEGVPLAAAAQNALQRANYLHEDIPIDGEETHLGKGLYAGLPGYVLQQGDFSEVITPFVCVNHLILAVSGLVCDQLSLCDYVEAVAHLSFLYNVLFGRQTALLQTLKQLGSLVDVQVLEEFDFVDERLTFVDFLDHLGPQHQVELLPVQLEEFAGGKGSDGGGTRMAVEQGQLPEELACLVLPQDLRTTFFLTLETAFLHYIEDIPDLSLSQDDFVLLHSPQPHLGDQFEQAVVIEMLEEDALFEVEQQVDLGFLRPVDVFAPVC